MLKQILMTFSITAMAAIFISGEVLSIDIYTFRKERVDQEVRGNRGYIVGTPPEAEDRSGRKRTLIGIDIELPFAWWRRDDAEKTVAVTPEKDRAERYTPALTEPSPPACKISAEKDRHEIDDGWIDDDWIK